MTKRQMVDRIALATGLPKLRLARAGDQVLDLIADTASEPREVMDAHQVADYLGLAVSTVYKKVEYREIPFTKVGTLLSFPKWLIDRWLTERAVRPDETLSRKFVRMPA